MSAELLELRTEVRNHPKDANLRAKLATALLRAGDPHDALTQFREARGLASEDIVVPGMIEALLTLNSGNELLQEFPEPDPNSNARSNADILAGRAIVFQTLGHTDEANSEVERALKLRRDARTLNAAALVASQQKDSTRATALIEEAARLSPNDDKILVTMTSLLMENRQRDRALAVVDSFQRRLPKNANAMALRVEILISLNRDSDATAAIDQLANVSDTPLVQFYRALILARAKQIKQAWDEAKTIPMEFAISQPALAQAISDIAISAGYAQSAQSVLGLFIAKHPENMELRLPLAAAQLTVKDAKEALRTLEPLSRGNDPAVQVLMAQAYLQQREYGGAVAALERSRGVGSDPFQERQLAFSLLQYVDTKNALQELQEVADAAPTDWNVAALQIETLIQIGRLDEASTTVDRIAKVARSPLENFYRGQIANERGDLAGAFAEYTKAIDADSKFLPARYYRADVSVRRGDEESARSDLNKILSRDPRNIFAYLRLAQIAVDDNRDAEVRAVLKRAIAAAPNEATPHLALIKYVLARGEYASATSLIDALLKQFPDNAEGLALQGQLRFASGDKAGAISSFKSLAARNRNFAAAHLVLAKAYDFVDDRSAAIDAAKAAVAITPYSLESRSVLVGLLIIADHKNDALDEAKDFSVSNPGPDSDLLLADTLTALGRKKEAVAALDNGLAFHPSGAVVQRLSQIVVADGDMAKGQRLLSDWLANHGDDFDARQQYATTLFQAGDRTAARGEFEEIVKRRPDNVAALNNLGWIIQDDDLPRAISLLSHAAKIAPRSADILDTFGWLSLRNRDSGQAVALLTRARSLRTDDGEIAYHLALALDAAGKRAEAKNLLQSVIAQRLAFEDIANAKQLLAHW